jgi:hypothetical protein
MMLHSFPAVSSPADKQEQGSPTTLRLLACLEMQVRLSLIKFYTPSVLFAQIVRSVLQRAMSDGCVEQA